ncbi:hypothetical protein KA005_75670, partial [bacterium]|nr:hypothetical protein [bacterium]
TYFNIATNKLQMLQKLVKRFDGRFLFNPSELFGGKSSVGLSFDDVRNYNKFSLMKFIIEQPFF